MDRRSQESFNFVKHTSTIFIPESFIKIGGINSVAGNICVGKHWKKHVIFAQSVTPQFHLLSAFAPVLSTTLLWWSNSGYVYENASTQCPEIISGHSTLRKPPTTGPLHAAELRPSLCVIQSRASMLVWQYHLAKVKLSITVRLLCMQAAALL